MFLVLHVVVQGVDDPSWESRTGYLLLVDRTRGWAPRYRYPVFSSSCQKTVAPWAITVVREASARACQLSARRRGPA